MEAGSKWALFFYGAFGGLMPTLVNLATTFVTAPENPWPALTYLVGLLIFGVIGGGIALTNSNMEIRQAIFTGIAAPAIIAGVMSGVTESAKKKTADLLGPIVVALFIQPAAAQTSNPSPASNAGTLVIKPTVIGNATTSTDIPITALVKTADGKDRRVLVGTMTKIDSSSAFQIPAGSSQVFISDKAVPVTGSITQADVTVTTKPTKLGDFLWALGASRTFGVQSIEVKPETK